MKRGSYGLDEIGVDRETERLHEQLEAVWTRERSMYESLGWRMTGHGLEVGCGPGFVLSKLRRQTDAYGIDLSRAALERATPPVAQADATQLPFADNQFDWALTRLVLRHSPDPEAILAEMMRVVRSGGRIIVSDTDDAGVLVHPEPVAWPTTLAERHAQIRERGADPHIGRKLQQLVHATGAEDVRVGALTLTTGDVGAASFAEILLVPLVSGLDTPASARTNADLTRWAAEDDAFGMASLIVVVGTV